MYWSMISWAKEEHLRIFGDTSRLKTAGLSEPYHSQANTDLRNSGLAPKRLRT